jgi:serine/threonine protein phosphatase 1
MNDLVKYFEPNLLGNDYVCGDMHGCLTLFNQQLFDICFDKEKDRMFCVGDLIDRGPDSLGCLKLLEEDWFFCCRGNHEDLMLGHHAPGHELEKCTPLVWLRNGGEWSLSTQISPTLIQKVIDLPLVMVVKKQDGTRINIVHAEFPDFTTDEMIDNGDLGNHIELIWRRNRCYGINDYRNHQYSMAMDVGLSRTYVGHTPVPYGSILGQYNFIDQGAGKGGSLTVVQL